MSNELLQIPDVGTQNSVGGILSKPIKSQTSSIPNSLTQQSHYHNSRKRKSKRSMQREKLEKTFKEKGFLIQTQQLEQAEGTYCKFRQLRKFTRYLFRSWKDYLPGELQHNQNQHQIATTSSAATLNPPILDQDDNDNSNFVPSPNSSSNDE